MTRIEKIQSALPEISDAFLITSWENRYYLTGLKSSAGVLFVAKTRAVLLIDFRYYDMAVALNGLFDVILMTDEEIQLKELLDSCGINRIFFETQSLSVSNFKKYRDSFPETIFSDDELLTCLLSDMRMIKSDEEISFIQKAQNLTDLTFDHILGFIKPGMAENEIATEIDYFFRKNGALEPSFSTIVLSGVNSCLPHGVPTDKKVMEGDFVLMDFGAKLSGYCSDMTRTVAIGRVSEEQRKVYETVLEAQKRALDLLKEGALCTDVDTTARSFIDEQGFMGLFGHSLGHSLGIEIHEEPRMSPKSKNVLKSGIMITVEPGIYLSGQYGVRIEDLALITKNGHMNFTKSPKELIIL